MSAGDFAARLRARDFYIVRDGPFPESAQEVERYVKVTPEERDALADLVDAALLAVPELERLAAIIEGRHPVARLVPPHGQSSASPLRALERMRKALARLGGSAEGEGE